MGDAPAISDAELLLLIDRIDRECFLKGTPPHSRGLQVTIRVCRELGVQVVLGPGQSPFMKRILALHQGLYRKSDISYGVYSGLTCHMDMFFRVKVPLIFGTARFDLFDATDITEHQRARLSKNRLEEEKFIDAAVDVFDIGGCLMPFDKYSKPQGEAGEYYQLSALHNQAAAATAIGAYDFRGAIQSALLCAELAMKSALLMLGQNREFIKNSIGHRLEKALPYLESDGRFNVPEMKERLDKLPDFVMSRYISERRTRFEIGEIVLSAQRILAIVARGHSQHSMRNCKST
ncbi:conserved hypothetical protein [Roseovarius sp. EC-HK134]|uniref:hypothetical protein n=1 Tax=unclassified Roseovarius TaxID=2614913 RepID=UPI00125A4F30|nr:MULTISPECIES: hypothetical protein [unclassified Roseovarius]VVT26838.1 conserved hypothetical protein [Roseovarius sp. EC-HK134]VVT26946.1 conserved hypothetical protein [Roseovarius sp. EC-SD190]